MCAHTDTQTHTHTHTHTPGLAAHNIKILNFKAVKSTYSINGTLIVKQLDQAFHFELKNGPFSVVRLHYRATAVSRL